jgi:hypothetical protein
VQQLRYHYCYKCLLLLPLLPLLLLTAAAAAAGAAVGAAAAAAVAAMPLSFCSSVCWHDATLQHNIAQHCVKL